MYLPEGKSSKVNNDSPLVNLVQFLEMVYICGHGVDNVNSQYNSILQHSGNR